MAFPRVFLNFGDIPGARALYSRKTPDSFSAVHLFRSRSLLQNFPGLYSRALPALARVIDQPVRTSVRFLLSAEGTGRYRLPANLRGAIGKIAAASCQETVIMIAVHLVNDRG